MEIASVVCVCSRFCRSGSSLIVCLCADGQDQDLGASGVYVCFIPLKLFCNAVIKSEC